MSATAIRKPVTLRDQIGLVVIMAAAALIVALGFSAGSPLIGLGVAGVLVVGSTLVSSGGDALGVKSASIMSSIHILGTILLTL